MYCSLEQQVMHTLQTNWANHEEDFWRILLLTEDEHMTHANEAMQRKRTAQGYAVIRGF
jgi:hypothetical protein